MQTLPEAGRLAGTALPALLLQLKRARFSGALALEREGERKRVLLRDGDPVWVDSSRASENLVRMLAAAGRLPEDAEARVAGWCEEHAGGEEAALVALRLLAPRDLVLAVRDAARRRILDAFGWSSGSFRLDPKAAPPAQTGPFRCDGALLVREGLVRRLPTERLVAGLARDLPRHPVRAEGFAAAVATLPDDAGTRTLLALLESAQPATGLLGAGASAEALATLFVLRELGAIAFQDHAPAATPEDEAGAGDGAEAKPEPPRAAGPEIEIVVQGSDGGAAAGGDAGARREAARKARRASGSTREAELRAEIVARHAALDELDHYALLGVERHAGGGEIKRAYVTAAKRFHPDALARLDLEDVKSQANEVFAAIAKAHDTLSDPERRASYDASLGGLDAEDAERVIQAEQLYRKGEVLLRAGNFTGALQHLQAAVDLWPEDHAYQSALGWVLYKKNPPDLARAREHLEHALTLEPDDGEARQRLTLVTREIARSA